MGFYLCDTVRICESIETESRAVVARAGGRRGGPGSDCFMGTGLECGLIQRFWNDREVVVVEQ